MEIDGLSIDKLRTKATELWETIVKLETEKYDLEERQKRQDYDVSFYDLHDSKNTEKRVEQHKFIAHIPNKIYIIFKTSLVYLVQVFTWLFIV